MGGVACARAEIEEERLVGVDGVEIGDELHRPVGDVLAEVITVLGPIAPGAMGVTQTHEHLLIDAMDHYPELQGGKGYGYLLEVFVPMLRERGVTDEQIHQIMVANPARAFSRSCRHAG